MASEFSAALAESQGKSISDVAGKEFNAGRYIWCDLLGSGGLGDVYLAKDTNLGNRLVAIKVLHGTVNGDDLRLFQREARLTASLQHSNIVSIFDFGVSDGQAPYMVLEYVSGKTLRELVGLLGTIEDREVIEIALQIIDALEYAHSHGVFHRDLKSANVLIQQSETGIIAKLIDFGVALNIDQRETINYQGRTIVGTPEYMPPDQVRGLPYDEQSEMYSFGCLLFELVSGRTPFQGETVIDLISRHNSQEPPRLEELRPKKDFSPMLESIIRKCLAKNKEDRYENFGELRKQLEQLGNDLSAGSEEFTSSHEATGTVRSPNRKNVFLVMWLSLIAVSFIGVILYVVLRYAGSGPGVRRLSSLNQSLPSSQVTEELADAKAEKKDLLKVSLPLCGDEDLKPLDGVSDVQLLALPNSSVTEKGLANLRKSTILKLDLNQSESVPIDGIIKYFPRVLQLDLENTETEDVDIAKLSALKMLKILNLKKTRVTEDGVKLLTAIPSLNLVYLGSNVSSATAQQMAAKMPDCAFHPYCPKSITMLKEKNISPDAPVKQRIAAYREIVEIVIRAQGENSPAVAHSLNSLALFCLKSEQLDEALKYCQRARTIALRIGDEFQLGSSFQIEGAIWNNRADTRKAVVATEKALKALRPLMLRNDPNLFSAEKFCTEMHLRLGDGQPTVDRALEGIDYVEHYRPKDFPSLAYFRVAAGNGLLREKRNEEARRMFVQGLSNYRKAKLEETPEYAMALTLLAGSLKPDDPKRMTYYLQVIELSQRLSPRLTKLLRDTHFCVGGIYQEQGNNSKAIEHFSEAFEIATRTECPETEAFAKKLISSLESAGRQAEADKISSALEQKRQAAKQGR